MNNIQNFKLKIDNDKILYFKKIWEDICSNINKPSLDFDIMTPHYLCLEILDEIEINKSKNKSNNKYYLSRLNDYYSNEQTIIGEIKNYFEILRRELQNPREIIVKQILNDVLGYFKKGYYFNILFEKLKLILFNSESLDLDKKNEIKKLSKHLIVEFILIGYNYKSIGKFISNVLSGYTVRDDEIFTNFPHGIEYNNDKEVYYSKIKEIISSISIKDRIGKIKDYYYATKSEYYYIFSLIGIIGDSEIKINNVTFYNPMRKKYITKTYHLKDYEIDNENNEEAMNVIVYENCIDEEQGKILAIEDIDKAFNVLKFITHSKSKFILNNIKCIILDKDYEEIGFHSGTNPETKSYNHLRIDNNFKYTNKRLQNISSFIFSNRTLTDTLHYYRKANEVTRFEEKIINYWISLEMLFNNIQLWNIFPQGEKESKITLIQEMNSRILLCRYVYMYGWDVYHELKFLIENNNANNEKIIISDDILNNAGLYTDQNNEGQIVYLYKFLDNLSEIIPSTNDEIMLEKLISIKEIYFDNKIAKIKLNGLFSDIKNEILLLYRIRNKIVHNAFYHSHFMEYYVNKLEFIVSTIFFDIIDKKGKEKFEENMIKKYVEYENINNRLEKDTNYTLYQYIKDRSLEFEDDSKEEE
jgi:hypothetical protein